MAVELVVLDLDETLIHANYNEPYGDADFFVDEYSVYKRNGLDKFLAGLFSRYKVGIYTLATKPYAEMVLDNILRPDQRVEFLFDRKRCVRSFNSMHGGSLPYSGLYSGGSSPVTYSKSIKKVKKLGYDIDRVVVLDDSPEVWARSYGNLVQVAPFFGELQDDELAHALSFVDSLHQGNQPVRATEKRFWKSAHCG